MSRDGSRAYLFALFLFVVGARFWLVHTYSSSLPYWDQWDTEGWLLLKPWREGQLHFGALFAPHNEHRLFLTRALVLGLYIMSGAWNILLAMMVNALFMGVFAVSVSAVLLRLFGATYRAVIFITVSLCFVLPFGWENTLCGFQSCLYFLSELSLLALWGLGLHRAGSRIWWAGLLGAVLACLAMGSGFVAAGCVLGALLVRAMKLRLWSAHECITCALCALLVLIGWTTRTAAPVNAPLRVGSFMELMGALGRYLAWPLPSHLGMAFWMVLPVAVLAVIYLRDRRPSPRVEILLLTAGWWMLQVLAMAYNRGGHGAPPPSRYTDLLALGVLASFFSLLCLLANTHLPFRVRAAVSVIWVIPVLFGLGRETIIDFKSELPQDRQWLQVQAANIQGYSATGDAQRYLAHKPIHDLPYPYVEELHTMLDDPTMRSLLQSDARSSRWVEAFLSQGKLIFFCGGLVLLLGWSDHRRARRAPAA